MLAVGDTLISEDIFSKNFVCNLEKCKGACCVEGDLGAPLTKLEIEVIDEILDDVVPYMHADGLKVLEEKSFWEDAGAEGLVTTCGDNGACVFVNYNDKGHTQCAIQLAYKDKKVFFEKPISCHLYPIRIKENRFHTLLNYDKWDICNPACSFGNELKVPIYKFLETPLTRRFGKDWYDELCVVAEAWQQQEK